jgi:hypothetical protein
MHPDDNRAVTVRAAVVRLSLSQLDTGMRLRDDPNILFLL